MNYFNLPCPVCSESMKDGDDIVVCPECATPHHRECWHKNGCCINQNLHAEGFVWKPDGAKPENPEPQPEADNTVAEEVDENNIICHVCGSENPKDSLHCGNCGALFGETEELPKKECPFCGTENPENSMRCRGCGTLLNTERENPFMGGTDMHENDPLGDYTAGDYALYTQLNARRYIPKFRKIQEKKITFNWGAFLFGANWFLFRKLYKIGIILLVVFSSITMMTAPLQTKLLDATEEFYAQSQAFLSSEANAAPSEAADAQAEKLINEYYSKSRMPLLVLTGIMLAQRLVCGFIADRLYYKKINADFRIIDEAVDDKNIRKMMIARRGSVSFLAFFAGNLGEQVILNLFVMAADAVSGLI